MPRYRRIALSTTQFKKYYLDFVLKNKATMHINLLILDEWFLYPLKDAKTRDLLEIAESRYKMTRRYSVLNLHSQLALETQRRTMADAICNHGF